MKDIKSLIIGFLFATSIFLLMGYKSKFNTPDNIQVKSISIINDAGKEVAFLGSHDQGGFLGVKNNLDNQVIYFGANNFGNGELSVWNAFKKQSLFLGATSLGDGRLVVNDIQGNQNVFIGTKDNQGFIATTNSDFVTTGSMPLMPK